MPEKPSTFSEIRLEQTAPSVGAEILDIDLSMPMSDGQFADIRRALGEYGVIFFRDQVIPAIFIGL